MLQRMVQYDEELYHMVEYEIRVKIILKNVILETHLRLKKNKKKKPKEIRKLH